MTGWNLEYKCRRCGETVTRGTLFGDILLNKHMFDEKKIVHTCDEQHVGICDLVGFQGEEADKYKVLDEN